MSIQLQYFFLFILLCFVVFNDSYAQGVLINEMVLSNAVLLDEDNDTPDWFELFNAGPDPINLQNWTITDDPAEPSQWAFPNVELAADEYLLIWASDKDRTGLNIPRTHLTETDAIRYIIPTGPVDSAWRLPGYDDSSWINGAANLGYGDEDDITTVPAGTISVYLRKRFTVAEPELVSRLVLDIDYDDSFVAYLNGVEIARANISDAAPIYNSTAITDREAQLYQGGSTERYTFDDLDGLLMTGENILSIQVHNVGNFSSDMSLRPWMSLLYDSQVQEGIPPPQFLEFPLSNLHTNFKLSSSGEVLYLFDASETLMDSLSSSGPLTADLSVGKLQNQPELVRVFTVPSPMAANPDQGFLGVLQPDIIFSQPGGPVSPLQLTLSGVAPPAVIRYTTDATTPTESSQVFSSAIDIDNNTVLRARIYRDGFLPSPVQTESYLVDVMHDLPVIALAAEPDDFFDEETGIYAFGNDYSTDFPYFGANFWEDWERPIHLALYETNGDVYAFDGGVKIFGGWSRAQEQRSLSIFARGRFGPSEIDYPLFPEQLIDEYQAIVLRNSGNDWLRSNFRDAVLTGLLRNSILDVQAARPAVTYLNGEYWGIYHLREKVNEHFLASHHGISPDEINILEFEGSTIHGDNSAYLQLIDFVENNDLSLSSNYDWVKEQLDIANMVLYQASQIYFDNTDWPGNNIKFWNSSSTKWRWILFDTDFGFGTWNGFNYFNNTLAFALEADGPAWPNPPWSTLLFRRLIDNLEYRNQFVNQLADEMNSRFLPERICEHIDTMAQRIAPEIPGHYLRWGGDSDTHTQQVNTMKNFAERRPEQVKQHVLSQFSLPAFYQLTIQNNQPERGWVHVNSLRIDDSNWNGDYFAEVPIDVTAIAAAGYRFSHWTGTLSSNEAHLQFAMSGPETLIPVFEEIEFTPIVINEINYNSSEERPTGDWIELYNPNPFPFDISGWWISDDDDEHEFHFAPGTMVDSAGFLVIVRNREDFGDVYADIPIVAGMLDFGLSSNGDQVRLFDISGNLQDSVAYSPNPPWPTAANGMGPTLELLAPDLDNLLPESWSNVNPWGSPGAPNVLSTSTTKPTLAEVAIDYYPNPSKGPLRITLDLQEQQAGELRLYNNKGQYLQTLLQERIPKGRFEQQFDLTHLPSGAYHLVLYLNGRAVSDKMWIKA